MHHLFTKFQTRGDTEFGILEFSKSQINALLKLIFTLLNQGLVDRCCCSSNLYNETREIYLNFIITTLLALFHITAYVKGSSKYLHVTSWFMRVMMLMMLMMLVVINVMTMMSWFCQRTTIIISILG